MREFAFAVPGDLATPTGGYVYARRLIAALPALGWRAQVIGLPGSFPSPTDADLTATAAVFAEVPRAMPLLVDGLAFGALPQNLLLSLRRDYIALVHHPLADETGLTEAVRDTFIASERHALTCARHVICTSAHTAQTLRQNYDVPAEAITVARPGTDVVTPAERVPHGSEVILLTVATLTPRKGHLALIEALGGLRHLPWRCVFVGSRDRDQAYARAVSAAIAAQGLTERIVLMDAVAPAQLGAFYRDADIFVLPSLHEGFGMAFAEAMAHGLPIIGCAAGAVPETVPAGAGFLVPPQSSGALRDALATLIADSALRARMGTSARDAAAKLPRWDDTARIVAQTLEALS